MNPAGLIEKFRTVGLERLEAMNLAMIALERDASDDRMATDLLREIHTLKGEAKMMGFADVNLVAHQTESLLMEAQSRYQWRVPQTLADCVFEGLDTIRLLLTKTTGGRDNPVDLSTFVARVQTCLVGDLMEFDEHEESSAMLDAPADATSSKGLGLDTKRSIRVRFEKLERLVDHIGELMLMSQRIQFQMKELGQTEEQLRQWIGANEAIIPNKLTNRLQDISHHLSSTLSLAKGESERIKDRAMALDTSTRSLRHISLEQVIGHYPRAVRDLAKSMQKQVQFISNLGTVEVDRNILERLSEPLLHLVRNAVDHGIESPEERERKGKPTEGTITLHAREEGSRLILELEDDGRGINASQIRTKAIQRGMMDELGAAQLSDKQALSLIFEPGFTTRTSVSDISGRGLGMDIVLRQLTNLGGSIELDSMEERGTRFRLTIPLGSTVTQVLKVVIDHRHYAVQTQHVERVINQRVLGILTLHGNLCIRHDGRFIPLVDWRHALHGKSGVLPNDGEIDVLLMRKGDRHLAIWVDEVVGEAEGMTRPLGKFLGGLPLCRGVVTTHTDESLSLLDTIELTKRGESNLHALTTQDYPLRRGWRNKKAPKAAATILVAEDSEITRMLVTEPLRGQGMTILEAEDGREALDLLQSNHVDLILTDIQMPHVDGLTLIESVRADQKHQHVPIIVLSTLGSPEDRDRALRRGASAYLVKLDFREQDLIKTVTKLLGESKS